MLRPLVIIGVLASVQPAAAGDVVFGLGYSSFADAGARNSAIMQFEVHSDPIWQWAGADWSVGVAVDLHTRQEFWAGAGLSAKWALRNDWFVEASVMPGYYSPGNSGNTLGSSFEIRSLLGLGVNLSDRVSVSLAITHKSNANTGRSNPGVNALMLRTRWAF